MCIKSDTLRFAIRELSRYKQLHQPWDDWCAMRDQCQEIAGYMLLLAADDKRAEDAGKSYDASLPERQRQPDRTRGMLG